MSREILYIGMDDSNHGETKSRVGEIIVASYSHNKLLWNEKKSPDSRDYSRVEECLEKRLVDYIYTILPHEVAKHKYSNLPLVAPFFVEHLISQKWIPEIKIGLDGQLHREDKTSLIKYFEGRDISVSISNYIKRNKVHVGPELIYLSHLLANHLFSTSMLEIARDDHYVPFDILKI
ncbi:MAG: hypothetical protein WAU65_01340 [Candidatus Nanoarchaeia archaeon]